MGKKQESVRQSIIRAVRKKEEKERLRKEKLEKEKQEKERLKKGATHTKFMNED